MSDLRAVIVDDEPIARRLLRRMLSDFHGISICGETDSVDEAERLIKETRAEVVFLDIELIGASGFDLVPRLDKDTAVIFVTAFNEYAIRAFEVNALDYLIKPVSEDRLAESIRRLGERQRPRTPSTSSEHLSLGRPYPGSRRQTTPMACSKPSVRDRSKRQLHGLEVRGRLLR